MIRVKSYIKWLAERDYLDGLRASDIPINKRFLNEPVYLNKAEFASIAEYLDKRVAEVERTKYKKRDWKYPAYMARALVRMLYTT